MKLYGLIGKKLSHSFSPEYFQRKFKKLNLDAEYSLFEIDDISGLPEIIKRNKNIKGLNVTIPFKKSVIPFLDYVDPVAGKLSAVNTVKIYWQDDLLFLGGFNTDVIGFEDSIIPLVRGRRNLSALVLGTGGSAQSVAFVLKKLGIEFRFVSRTAPSPEVFDYDDLNEEVIAKNQLIINTTPVGMFPDVEGLPALPYNSITKNHILFDLVYNPVETNFLRQGKKYGALVSSGLQMLEIQADASWAIWQE